MSSLIITADNPKVLALRKKEPRLGVVVDLLGDISFRDYSDGYSFIVCQIVGQMISQRVAKIFCERLRALCDGEISPRTISRFPASELKNIGLSRPKCQYILGFTEAILNKELVLDELEAASDDEVMKRLTAIKGIGTWTAKMYLLCVLRRDDILPYEDKVFAKAFKWLYNLEDATCADIKKRGKRWSPYASIGVLYLYHATAAKLTSRPFSEYEKAAKQRIIKE